jgi:hypothetical protein
VPGLLTRVAGASWNTGAISTKRFDAGDGYVEMTVPAVVPYLVFGLTHANPDYSYTSIDFCILTFPTDNSLRVYEGGTQKANKGPGTLAPGDVLRVAVESGVVNYYRNGVLQYTSLAAPTYPLFFDCSLNTGGSSIEGATISAAALVPFGWGLLGDPEPITWWRTAGVTVDGPTLTKTASAVWGNAGAISTRGLRSGMGYVEFTAPDISCYQMVGLSNGNTNLHYNDIDFAAYIWSSGPNLLAYESGVSKGTIMAPLPAAPRIRVSVRDGVVEIWVNGSRRYSSVTAPTFPLLMDCSLLTTGTVLQDAAIAGEDLIPSCLA